MGVKLCSENARGQINFKEKTKSDCKRCTRMIVLDHAPTIIILVANADIGAKKERIKKRAALTYKTKLSKDDKLAPNSLVYTKPNFQKTTAGRQREALQCSLGVWIWLVLGVWISLLIATRAA